MSRIRIENLVGTRAQARAAGNWTAADHLRDELSNLDIHVRDNRDADGITAVWEIKTVKASAPEQGSSPTKDGIAAEIERRLKGRLRCVRHLCTTLTEDDISIKVTNQPDGEIAVCAELGGVAVAGLQLQNDANFANKAVEMLAKIWFRNNSIRRTHIAVRKAAPLSSRKAPQKLKTGANAGAPGRANSLSL